VNADALCNLGGCVKRGRNCVSFDAQARDVGAQKRGVAVSMSKRRCCIDFADTRRRRRAWPQYAHHARREADAPERRHNSTTAQQNRMLVRTENRLRSLRGQPNLPYLFDADMRFTAAD